MKLSFQKKVLLSMGVVAGIGALAGAGTFATFTAQTTNPTNTFADGTLVLSNKVGTGTACLSTGGLTTDVAASIRGRVPPVPFMAVDSSTLSNAKAISAVCGTFSLPSRAGIGFHDNLLDRRCAM